VEASADLGLLVPSLRVESFHNALYESMSLAGKAVTAGRMLQRLGSAIRAELTAIESIERRGDENRRVRYAVAVGFVSAVAIPASLVLAFLGINAAQVNSSRSMFSHQYLGMYLTVAAVIVLGAVLSLALYVQQRRDARHHRTSDQRSRWTLAADETHY
jgi:Flp pilus assembly protein TadB